MVCNPWKDYEFSFWHSTDGCAIRCRKSPKSFSVQLIIKLTSSGVYRYSYSYNDVAAVDSDWRIRVIRQDFDSGKLYDTTFVEHDSTLLKGIKLRLWGNATLPVVFVTTPGIYVHAFCLLAITPDGLWRCRYNPESVVPVDEFGRVRILRGSAPGINN